MENTIKVSDLYRLAVLDCMHVPEVARERDRRYYGIFDEFLANKVLNDYDSGILSVSAREFVASIQRVKDRIFEGNKTKALNPDLTSTNGVPKPA